MQIFRTFTNGLLSVLHVTASPMLYRYPYRISAEGMRADWNRISEDITNAVGRLDEYMDFDDDDDERADHEH